MRFGHSFAVRASPPMKCRQCPGYSSPLTAFSSTSLGTTASSVASDHVMVTPPPYTCPIPAVHILCHCCMQPMPNHLSDTTMPKQKCAICRQAYCHLYWGCRSPNCRGCLGSFKDINLADHHLNGILNNGNQYESDVLKNYLKAKGLSIRDLLQVCAARVDSGEYHCSGGPIQSDTTVCYKCCLKEFQEAVFCYRKDILVEDLPAEVVSRPDCYWGKNCRTQYNKPHHARHFNHICEQTRF
jgi:E3 ubiquitin-protein ligase CHFR